MIDGTDAPPPVPGVGGRVEPAALAELERILLEHPRVAFARAVVPRDDPRWVEIEVRELNGTVRRRITSAAGRVAAHAADPDALRTLAHGWLG